MARDLKADLEKLEQLSINQIYKPTLIEAAKHAIQRAIKAENLLELRTMQSHERGKCLLSEMDENKRLKAEVERLKGALQEIADYKWEGDGPQMMRDSYYSLKKLAKDALEPSDD